MSDVDGTCEYVLDPEDPETWGGEEGDECYVDEDVLNEDGVWTCPHDTGEGEDLCVFHLPVDEKDDEKVVNAFLDALAEADTSDNPETQERKMQFLGSIFGSFDLTENPPEVTVGEGEMAMTHTLVSGRLDWSGSKFDVNYISFRGVTFEGDTDFRDTLFGGETDFELAKFKKNTYFGGLYPTHGHSGKAVFRGDVIFRSVDFNGSAQFGDALTGVEFGQKADFSQVKFKEDASFSNVQFREDANFWISEFRGDAEFEDAEFGGEVNFEGAEFNESAEFSGVIIDNGRFNEANLTDAKFTAANLSQTNFESTLLSRATLFGADLRGAKLSGAVLGDVRIDEGTEFLGHPSDDGDSSPHTLSAIRSRPTCVYDPDYEQDNEHEDVDKAKSVYRALEELGGKHARPRLQARSFVRRQDLQKDEYKRDAKEAESWEERFIAGARWSRAKIARATLLYGESPWRVIAWSLGIIFSFALLYPLGGWMKPTDGDPITYAQIASNPVEILNSVYYSTLTYTALGFGDFQPVGFGRLLTTLETGFGAVMLALLVFILGRRAAR